MPQETNLNVAPYFDDFDSKSSYCKILFKPGTPVQARELTGIQSLIQNQIEKFGSHIFKDGASVTGGGIKFNGAYNSVKIQRSNEGIDVRTYLADLVGKVVIGSNSGVKAKIKSYIGQPSASNNYVLFISYLNTGGQGNEVFVDGESLLLDGTVLSTRDNLIFQPGQPIAQTVTLGASAVGSAAVLSAGIYFVRGYFVDVPGQTVVISPYSRNADAQIGLEVKETIVNSDSDSSLNDNAAGYSNYSAPGADRLSIKVRLKAISINERKPSNFISLMEVRNGNLLYVRTESDYNDIGNELAQRTFDESGNYYVRPFSLNVRETLNNYQGNNGIFNSNQLTYNNNTPSDDLATYSISPGKAYVGGFEVETITPTFLDLNKPRTTKLLEGQSINYVTGPTFTLNRVSGSPILGIGTDYTVSLRDQRIGAAATTAAGAEIGLARVYDFALEAGSYNASNASENEWDIALYDIQTYTKVALNTPATLAVPTHVKGKSSGATGFLRSAVTSSTDVTLYNTKGKFITGEQFIFNGIDSSNISVGSTSYTTSDIKSINGTVSTASTFNSDVKLSVFSNIGQVNITNPPSSGASAGISTVTFTDPTKFFVGIATVGNIVEYANPGKSTVSYARVESVSQHSLTISGVSSVTGICDGGLPSTTINPSNFKILSSQFQSSTDNTLYTELPKDNVSTVDLTDSHITIRRQFDVTISGNTTGAVSSGDANQTFLPYDEEDYVLIRTDGTTEPLSADKFTFNTGSTAVTVSGLSGSGPSKLIATLRKVKVKEKIKEKQKINILTIANSKNSQSGIGTTTLNDGLTYGTVYGTRVQDEEISLNTPDVTKVYGIYESLNVGAPSLPVLTLSSINSDTAKTGDLLIGEKFIGDTSQCCAIYASKNTDSAINYISLNDYGLLVGETVTFEESGITATVDALAVGSHNITDEFVYDDGQKSTIYDYSRIVRKSGYDAPSKQISIIFESAYFSAADTGDITTINSYNNFDYKNLPAINDTRVSDIIDIRPRVSDFSGTSRSPFEFLGRSFDGDGNSAANILASDGSILLDYSFFLPRFDKIYLSKNGTFQLVKGIPAETPEFPVPIDGALEVASIKLPAYLYNVNQVSINIAQYKRYQMSDINKLEKRIENLEFYTSLTLLENDTLNMQITDSDGLNRFKSGFFVDDFANTENQIKTTIVKNSIDYNNGELRPSPFTTELDLQLDLNSANGIIKTGRCLTLDYEEVVYVDQPFATRVENVTPYLVSYYGGTLDLLPSSDVWVDQVVLEAKQEDLTTYTESTEQLDAGGFDSRTGYSPVTWGAWNHNWTGHETVSNSSSSSWQGNQLVQTTTTSQRRVGSSTRTGTKQLTRETFSTINEGPKVINTQISAHMRSRNIKFDARTLRPNTSMYAFFDGQDVAKYIIPKLVEISMTTGTFEVGETVVGTDSNGKELIRFRVAQSNHKRGPIDSPSQTYGPNPYYQFTSLFGSSVLGQQGARLTLSAPIVDTITPNIAVNGVDDANILGDSDTTGASSIVNVPELYSSTSVILNIDLASLSTKSNNTFFGYIERNLRLVGQTSNAQATVSNVRLKSDNLGNLIGSFFIPNPNDITSPKFDVGKKVFRLTSSALNAQNEGLVTTDATKIFEATGDIETLQSTIISVKNIHTNVITRVESKSLSGGTTSTSSSRVVDTRVPPRAPTPIIVPPPRTYAPTPVLELPQPEPPAIDDTPPPKINVPNKGGTEIIKQVENVKEIFEEFVALPPEYQAGGNKDMSEVVVGALGVEGVDMSLTSFRETFPEVVDPIAAAWIQVKGSDESLQEGGALYWSTQIAVELGPDAAAEDIQNRMVEHLEFAADAEKLAEFSEWVDEEIAAGTEQGQEFAAGAQTLQNITGLVAGSGDYSSLDDSCGMGQEDPLAQSFYVGDGSGIFITRVDLYFGTKDEFLPVTVQLRTLKAGVPTTEVIPFGEVVLEPEQVNVSSDASAVTEVRFPSPVYLPGGKSYSVVLLSTSSEYTAWISRMGETDVQTRDNPESEQIIVGVQPTLGSLFKSQNGETWNPSQYEDLKFTLYRARFSSLTGTVSFTNPPLLTYSENVAPLLKDSFEIKSNRIRVGFNTTISDAAISIGNLISQQGSNATGRYVGSGGTATGNLTITNAGVGYTPSSGSTTYNFVPMVTETGTGRDGTLNMTITNGVAVAATVASGGSGYSAGDIIGVSTVGSTSLGSGIKFSIASITGVNEFVLDNVQGEFATGIGKTIQYIAGAASTDLNGAAGGNVFLSGTPAVTNDGLHIKVNQKNHGMYSSQNTVTIDGVDTDLPLTQLAAEYSNASTGSIVLDDATNFAEFENVGVGSTNLGYIKVGSEILSYSGVTANTLTGVTRGVDSTSTLTHDALDFVHKYELNGVSLRRINTNHNLADATVTDPRGLDFYNIKIDMSSNGINRSTGTSLPKLKFNQTKSTGSTNVLSTENIPFDIITPIVQNMTPTGTTINGQVRTVTSTSVDGSELPFVDKGFTDISIVGDNYMSSPRMIASRINETTSLPNLPNNKSFTLNLGLSSLDNSLSPVVDLDRVAVILTSNRLNQPITNYITDNRINTLQDDPNAFVYASKQIALESGATGIKVHLEGHINLTSDLRAFYAISENPNDELVYQAFPGYDNLLSTGQIIDPAKNSGLPDKALPKTDVIAYTPDQVVWNDYEFTIDNLATFRYFSIKLVGTGTNSSQPPRVRNLRVIALA